MRRALVVVTVFLVGCATTSDGVSGSRAASCQRYVGLIDDGDSLSSEEFGERWQDIGGFSSDWGILGDSWERLNKNIAEGDMQGVQHETNHLYDLCVNYLADQ